MTRIRLVDVFGYYKPAVTDVPVRAKHFISASVWVSLLAFCLPPGLAAQSGQVGTAGDSERAIRGTVVNRVTREPISRALVYSTDERYATLTDDEGHFELKFVSPQTQAGAYQGGSFIVGTRPLGPPESLLARKPGFLPLVPGQVTVALVAGRSNPVIYLDPVGYIIGKVTASDATSEVRFYLELYRRVLRDGEEHWDQAGSFNTWSDGEFRFWDLMPGVYKLVTHEQLDRDAQALGPNEDLFGFPANFYPGTPDFAAAEEIHVAAGQTVEANLSATRKRYYRVKIPVRNGGAGGMNVRVYPLGHPGPGFSLGYDSGEQAIVGMLPDGAYTVSAVSQEQTKASGTANFSVRGAAVEGPALNVVPSASLKVNVKELLGAEQSVFEGRPTFSSVINIHGSSSGARRSNVRVNLHPLEQFGVAEERVSQAVQGDEEDILELANVLPGKYSVQVSPGVGYASSVLYGGIDLIRQPLVVGVGGGSSPIEVTLRDDGAEVTGAINAARSADGDELSSGFSTAGQTQLPQCYVYFLPSEGGSGQYREAMSAPDGTFREQQLPPGKYLALAFSKAHEELSHDYAEAASNLESQGQVIQVGANQKIQLRLTPIREEGQP